MNRIQRTALGAALVALGAAADGRTAAAQASDAFLGQIITVGFTYCPQGWAEADGQLLQISQNSALFSLLGTTYGGNGTSTFALPDLRGRVAVNLGAGPGLSQRQQGQTGGAETTSLTEQNLPPHSHALNALSANGSTGAPAGNLPAGAGRETIYGAGAPDVAMAGTAIGATGGGAAVDRMPPFLVLRHCIALQGIYPSRN